MPSSAKCSESVGATKVLPRHATGQVVYKKRNKWTISCEKSDIAPSYRSFMARNLMCIISEPCQIKRRYMGTGMRSLGRWETKLVFFWRSPTAPLWIRKVSQLTCSR